MTIVQEAAGKTASIERLLLTREIEDFLYREADTIDARRFEEWLSFFADDLRYWVPIRKNLPFNRRFDDMTNDYESAWIDDTRATLEARVYQIMTKIHWAEEPLSRVSHLVSNVYVDKVEEQDGDQVIVVRSKLLCHRSRMEEAGEMLLAKREDRIRREEDGLKVFWRKITIDQATLHVKNLSFFL
ncbi:MULTISPECIES: aromatic-ring-hydroxylating dioxygenase subunit beta [Sphingobium]|uniref:aromatic-ring-hydroxylating dioxygenase subunit beta n=1 Tax=Sphingobium TaxID=165695 RepID=UPI002100EDFB|nr:3-phenylpropionate/cinnamic acid dioxygenase subunit beta [Sphingobium sp. 15-1]